MPMKFNYDDLLEDWIIYLKSEGIVNRKSQEGGELQYFRRPDQSDIINFLKGKGFDRQAIRDAIQAAGEPAGKVPPKEHEQPQDGEQQGQEQPQDGEQQGEQQQKGVEAGTTVEFPGTDKKYQWLGAQWAEINPKTGKPAKIANKEISQVLSQKAQGQEPEMRDLLSARRKVGLQASLRYTGNKLLEQMKLQSYSEEQIQNIFKQVTGSGGDQEEPGQEKKKELELVPKDHELGLVPKDEDTPEYQEKIRKREQELNAIKKSIRDKFSDTQRKALWRMLSNAR